LREMAHTSSPISLLVVTGSAKPFDPGRRQCDLPQVHK
jgi:hypothetical protein